MKTKLNTKQNKQNKPKWKKTEQNKMKNKTKQPKKMQNPNPILSWFPTVTGSVNLCEVLCINHTCNSAHHVKKLHSAFLLDTELLWKC